MPLSVEETNLWLVALGIGAVVIIVVIALLGLLLHLVKSIEAGTHQLLAVAGGVAGNTANIKLALDVAKTLDQVTDEAVKHARLLGVRL